MIKTGIAACMAGVLLAAMPSAEAASKAAFRPGGIAMPSLGGMTACTQQKPPAVLRWERHPEHQLVSIRTTIVHRHFVCVDQWWKATDVRVRVWKRYKPDTARACQVWARHQHGVLGAPSRWKLVPWQTATNC